MIINRDDDDDVEKKSSPIFTLNFTSFEILKKPVDAQVRVLKIILGNFFEINFSCEVIVKKLSKKKHIFRKLQKRESTKPKKRLLNLERNFTNFEILKEPIDAQI